MPKGIGMETVSPPFVGIRASPTLAPPSCQIKPLPVGCHTSIHTSFEAAVVTDPDVI